MAAFGASNRAAAEKLGQKIQDEKGVKVQLALSEDGKHVRVLVGSYADRATAQADCRKLRKEAGWSDSFVKELE